MAGKSTNVQMAFTRKDWDFPCWFVKMAGKSTNVQMAFTRKDWDFPCWFVRKYRAYTPYITYLCAFFEFLFWLFSGDGCEENSCFEAGWSRSTRYKEARPAGQNMLQISYPQVLLHIVLSTFGFRVGFQQFFGSLISLRKVGGRLV